MTPIYEFDVEMIPFLTSAPVITCSQYDVGRPFTAHLKWNRQSFTIAENSTVTLQVRKPSGNICTFPVVYADDTVYFELEEQMTPEAGKCQMEIKIEEESGETGSANFILNCEHSVLDGGVDTESKISEIETARRIADETATSAAAAQRSAEAAAASAEEAMQGTPEGYAGVVDQVNTNKSDIATLNSSLKKIKFSGHYTQNNIEAAGGFGPLLASILTNQGDVAMGSMTITFYEDGLKVARKNYAYSFIAVRVHSSYIKVIMTPFNNDYLEIHVYSISNSTWTVNKKINASEDIE